jgi:alkylation response protein AidB-like acyl-CoA dehydrogenase
MHFEFSEDQRLLQQTVRDFLDGACPVERLRALWDSETGRSPELWSQLAEVGVLGLLVPEKSGGLGMDEVDQVLVLEETGRAALAEPVVSTAAVGVPLILGIGSEALCERFLGAVAAGDAIIACGHPVNRFIADAHVADLLLLVHGEEIHGLTPDAVELTAKPSNDPSRRIFDIAWTPSRDTLLAGGEAGAALAAFALDRAALACAAQQLGVADRLIEMAVRYASEREQFGAAIGSFQAIKHLLANVKVKLEYARSLVYRAAYSLSRDEPGRSLHTSMAKLAASEAATGAARTALQVHGAIGYTWEQDLHVWMRRAWSLQLAWGDAAWHRARLATSVIDRQPRAETFGYESPRA